MCLLHWLAVIGVVMTAVKLVYKLKKEEEEEEEEEEDANEKEKGL